MQRQSSPTQLKTAMGGRSVAAFAEFIGLSRQMIYLYLNESQPLADNLALIADKTGYSLDFFYEEVE